MCHLARDGTFFIKGEKIMENEKLNAPENEYNNEVDAMIEDINRSEKFLYTFAGILTILVIAYSIYLLATLQIINAIMFAFISIGIITTIISVTHVLINTAKTALKDEIRLSKLLEELNKKKYICLDEIETKFIEIMPEKENDLTNSPQKDECPNVLQRFPQMIPNVRIVDIN